MNSSPPLILRKCSGNSVEFSGRIRGNFGKIQGNSVEFSMALSMNSVGIPGGFRGNAGFSGKFGVWGGFGRFGGSKGFCANSQNTERVGGRESNSLRTSAEFLRTPVPS